MNTRVQGFWTCPCLWLCNFKWWNEHRKLIKNSNFFLRIVYSVEWNLFLFGFIYYNAKCGNLISLIDIWKIRILCLVFVQNLNSRSIKNNVQLYENTNSRSGENDVEGKVNPLKAYDGIIYCIPCNDDFSHVMFETFRYFFSELDKIRGDLFKGCLLQLGRYFYFLLMITISIELILVSIQVFVIWLINPFSTNAPLLHSLKTLENVRFSSVNSKHF